MFPASKIKKISVKKKKKWLLLIGFNPDQLRHFIDFSKGTKTHSLRVAFVTRMLFLFNNLYSTHVFFFFFHTPTSRDKQSLTEKMQITFW